jgi:hypothetical protein
MKSHASGWQISFENRIASRANRGYSLTTMTGRKLSQLYPGENLSRERGFLGEESGDKAASGGKLS